jgi:hypothetical protein
LYYNHKKIILTDLTLPVSIGLEVRSCSRESGHAHGGACFSPFLPQLASHSPRKHHIHEQRKDSFVVFGLATFVGLNLLSNQLGAQTQAVTQAPVTTGAAVAAPQQGGELERITVTGYLIPRIGEGPQPVLTLDGEGTSSGIRHWLANTTFTFGINNIWDTRAPLTIRPISFGFNYFSANAIQRFFYVQLEKKF